jgi:chromosomal replication initiator protein
MDNKSLWKTVLAELQLTLTPGSYKTLFAKSEIVDSKNDVVEVALANTQIKTMVEERYYALLKEIVDRLTKKNNSLTFGILKEKPRSETKDLGPLFTNTFDKEDKKEPSEYLIQRLRLNPDLTFENFAVSGSNQLAYAAASAVTRSPGKAYNPLYVWGGVGVGKTHLIQAIAHSLLCKDPNTNIVYCSSEEFTNEITMAIRNKTTDKFKSKFRSARALLIDDIQFIAGKDTTQEEFFHTFNALQREGCQIILTSDKPPSEIGGLEDRIRSRFEGGLVVDIQPPDLELRTAILMIKAKQKGVAIEISLAQKIAVSVGEARQIEGMIVRFLSETENSPELSPGAIVDKILGQKPSTSNMVDPKKILGEVCAFYGLKTTDVRGEKRKREIVRPRQILMWLLRNESRLTLDEVGRFLGGRDHSTIIHGVEVIDRLLLSSENIRGEVLGIKQRIS